MKYTLSQHSHLPSPIFALKSPWIMDSWFALFQCHLYLFIKVLNIVCTEVTCGDIYLNDVDIKGLCVHFDHDNSTWYRPVPSQHLCVSLVSDKPTPRSCCCSPDYIIWCWSTVICSALVHLTSERPRMLTFIRSSLNMMLFSLPFWYIVRTTSPTRWGSSIRVPLHLVVKYKILLSHEFRWENFTVVCRCLLSLCVRCPR